MNFNFNNFGNFSNIFGNMSSRTLLLLGALGIAVVLLLAYFLLLGPLFGRLGDRADERDAKEQQLSQLQAQVQQLEAARNNSGELQRELLELNKRIPEEPEIPTFVVQVQEIAEASGVTQLSIEPDTPGPPEGGGPYSVVPITMTFEGTYEQLQDFLLRSNDLARLTTVKRVTYQPVEDGETTASGIERSLTVEIEAEVYFQPRGENDESTAPVAPGAPETTTPQEATG